MSEARANALKQWQRGFIKLSKHTLISYLIVSTIFVGSGIIFLFNPFGGGIKQAEAAWFNDNWGYRKEVPITANAAADTNAFFSFTLDTATLITAGQLQSSCQDIRVTDVSGNILAYHVGRTNACNNAATTIDALAPYAANGGVPTLPAGASTFYVYYGNPSVGSKDAGAFTQSEAASYTVGTLGTAASAPSPTLYWKFDEAQGTNAEDSTTNGLDGTLSNGPAYQTENFCISSKCLYFAGTDDNVNKTDDAKLDFVAADNFTLSAWVKRNGAASANTVILQKSGANLGSTYTGYKLYMDASGDFCFDIQDGTNAVDSACTSAVEFDDDQWHLVMGVKAATTSVTLYVDGKQRAQDASIASTGTLANASTLRVGVDSDGTSNEWLGFIDEVKVFRDQTARTAAQILADFNARSNPEGVSSQQGNNITNMPNALSNGLVGYWKMEESATPSIDSSGNGYSGTWAGNVAQTTGKYGFGTTYDGTGDYLTMGNVLDFERTNSFSISVWVKSASASPTAAMVILGKLGSNGNLPGYMLSLRGDTAGDPYEFNLRGVTSAEEIQVTFPRTADTNWQHVEVSYSGTSTAAGVKAYVNGVQQTLTIGVDNIASNATNTGSFNIGSRNDGSGPFSGSIDEARVYNRALSGAEVSQLYNWAPGPVGYWKMDEKTGTTANDSSGSDNNGAITGATWINGKYGAALNFDATDDIVTKSSANNISGIENFSACAWIYPKGYGENSFGRVVSIGTGEYYILLLRSDSTNLAFSADWDTDGSWRTATGSISLNTWYHTCVTYDASSTSNDPKFYINGVLQTTSDVTGPAGVRGTAPTSIHIGNNSATTRTFDGTIDDAKVYNYIRTQAQIIEDMNASHPAPGSPLSSTVATWKLDEGYGTSAQDWSGNANTLTLSTAAWTNAGKFLKAWNGDGTIWMSRATDSDLEFSATDDFSISMWFKTDSATNPTNGVEYLASDTTGNTDVGFNIYANTDGTICFGIDDDATWGPDVGSCTTADFYDGNWHHLTAVRNTTLDKTYIYIDALEKDSDTDSTTATLDGNNTFYIGDFDGDNNATAGIEEFAGDIDEIKVYRSALTAEQVKLDMNRSSSEVLGALSTSSDSQPNSAASEYCPPDSSTAICTGPVGEWKFDEGSGLTANDTTGNGSSGTITAGTGGYVNGKLNKGYNFDGADTVAFMSSPSVLDNLPAAGMTVEAWVYPRTVGEGSAGFIVMKNNGSSQNAGWILALSDTKALQFAVDGSTDLYVLTSNNVLSYNAWNHVSLSWDGVMTTASSVNIYVNGQEVTYATQTNGASRVADDASSFYVGNNNTSIRTFDGIIDNVRAFNYARSASQVAWDYNKGGPVAHWKMDECQGTTINDMSGFSNTGTLTIGATGGNTAAGTCTTSGAWFDGVSGKRNYSMDFDGTDDKISVTDSASWDFGSADFSVAWWEYRTSNSSGRTAIVRDGTDPRPPYLLGYSTGGANLLVYITSNGASWDIADAKSMGSVSLNQWVHLAITRIGSNFYTYKNGIQQDTWTSSGTINSSASALRLGGPYTAAATDYYYSGLLDDVKIYNYGLTLTQIKTLYNEGATRYGPVTGAP